MNPYLSIIIPAYNEEKRIRKSLDAISEYLKKRSFESELLVVLDGVTDNTLEVVRKFASGTSDMNIRWLERKQNKGKGYTVREGMLEAKGDIRLFTDADNSTDISHFDKIKPLMDSGYDVVICSRESKDAKGATQAEPQKWIKRQMGNLGNLYIQFVAVPGIWDTQCGFKAFTKEAAEKIFSAACIDRWGFDIEALALARKFGYKIGIVPAFWINDEESHVSASGYIGVLYETLKIRWRLLTGKYK